MTDYPLIHRDACLFLLRRRSDVCGGVIILIPLLIICKDIPTRYDESHLRTFQNRHDGDPGKL